MASINYLILDISSPEKHETMQVTSVLAVTKNGEEEFLPLHSNWVGEISGQSIRLILNDSTHTVRNLDISDSIMSITSEDQRTKMILNTISYGDSINIRNQIKKNYQEDLDKSNTLIITELIPSLNPANQNLRDIETELLAEFENSLR
jgi:F0F1-type ATP synthase epsilon subunit